MVHMGSENVVEGFLTGRGLARTVPKRAKITREFFNRLPLKIGCFEPVSVAYREPN